MSNDLIVDDGLEEILNRLIGSALYCAVGSGSTAPVGTETELGTEVSRAAVSTAVVVGNVARLRAFFNTAQANGVVAEHGLFTASSGGIMIDKGVEVPTQFKTATHEMIVEKVIRLVRG